MPSSFVPIPTWTREYEPIYEDDSDSDNEDEQTLMPTKPDKNVTATNPGLWGVLFLTAWFFMFCLLFVFLVSCVSKSWWFLGNSGNDIERFFTLFGVQTCWWIYLTVELLIFVIALYNFVPAGDKVLVIGMLLLIEFIPVAIAFGLNINSGTRPAVVDVAGSKAESEVPSTTNGKGQAGNKAESLLSRPVGDRPGLMIAHQNMHNPLSPEGEVNPFAG